MGLVWFVLSLYAMFECAWHGKLQWSPGWNAIIFPTGTLATSTMQLADAMDSPAWRIITTILVVFLVIVYLGNLAGTMWKISRGELLIVRADPRVKTILSEKER
jgi:tellurite resistance protein TehA-like permease